MIIKGDSLLYTVRIEIHKTNNRHAAQVQAENEKQPLHNVRWLEDSFDRDLSKVLAELDAKAEPAKEAA